MDNIDLPGGDFKVLWTDTFQPCKDACVDTRGCIAVTWIKSGSSKNKCYLKNTGHQPARVMNGVISAKINCIKTESSTNQEYEVLIVEKGYPESNLNSMFHGVYIRRGEDGCNRAAYLNVKSKSLIHHVDPGNKKYWCMTSSSYNTMTSCKSGLGFYHTSVFNRDLVLSTWNNNQAKVSEGCMVPAVPNIQQITSSHTNATKVGESITITCTNGEVKYAACRTGNTFTPRIFCPQYQDNLTLGMEEDGKLLLATVIGKQGAVCSYNFGKDEANMACRHMGYPSAKKWESREKKSNYRSYTDIVLANLACEGSSTKLSNCKYSKTSTCKQDKHVLLECSDKLEFELLDSGLLLVQYMSMEKLVKGTVCDDKFNMDAAHFACKQLGFKRGAAEWKTNTNYAVIAKDTHKYETRINDFECNKGATKLDACSWMFTNDCQHTEDVTLKCKPSLILTNLVINEDGFLEAMLEDGASTYTGLVCHDEEYDVPRLIESDLVTGRYCEDSENLVFDQSIGSVIRNPNNIIVSKLACGGSLSKCKQFNEYTYRTQPGLKCSSGSGIKMSCFDKRVLAFEETSYGVLVVRKQDGRLGSICADGMDNLAAQLVCKLLGYGISNAEIKNSTKSTSGESPMITNLKCAYDAQTLSDCTYAMVYNPETCTDGFVDKVVCSKATGQCPTSHPNAYLNGRYCCKYDREKFWEPEGKTCDGSVISWGSSCCQDNEFVKCPNPPCVAETQNSWSTKEETPNYIEDEQGYFMENTGTMSLTPKSSVTMTLVNEKQIMSVDIYVTSEIYNVEIMDTFTVELKQNKENIDLSTVKTSTYYKPTTYSSSIFKTPTEEPKSSRRQPFKVVACRLAERGFLQQPRSFSYKMKFSCKKQQGFAVRIKAPADPSNANLDISVQLFVEKHTLGDASDESKAKAEIKTDSYFTSAILKTEAPFKMNDDQKNILNNEMEEMFKSSSSSKVVWRPNYKKGIPLNRIKFKMSSEDDYTGADTSIMKYLSFGGYLDVVTTDKHKKEKEAHEAKKAADPKFKSSANPRLKTTLENNDVIEAVRLLQRFNGFPETGEVSREMMEYIKQPRCGENDLEFVKVDEERKLCDSVFENAKFLTENIDTEMAGVCGQKLMTSDKASCIRIPSKNPYAFIASSLPYYIIVDLRFLASSGAAWDDLENNFAIFYNFDRKAKGGSGYGDVVKLFAEEDKFGFVYDKLTEDAKVVKKVKLGEYKLSSTQKARREFKVRIDVEEGGIAYLLVNNKDVGTMRYNFEMMSSALVRWAIKKPEIITARICKRPDAEKSRTKRYAASLHKWNSKDITFSFQNYSSTLGEKDTRQEILKALKLISKKVGLTFVEKPMYLSTMLTFMFIKGRHADGRGFYGPGLEKAHAFVPVNSEVHFNDHETFAVKPRPGGVSLFYIALHETGHALGLKHSEYRDAVMHANYDDNTAFQVSEIHRDDVRGLKHQYPNNEDLNGNVEELNSVSSVRKPFNYVYKPKLPIPRECINRIDAAFSVGDDWYLISNTFMWIYNAKTSKLKEKNRVSRFFSGWNYQTKAAFSVGSLVYLIRDGYSHAYQRYGDVFYTSKVATLTTMFNPKGRSTEINQSIKSAFTLPYGRRYKTTLIVSNTEFYEIEWKNSKKVVKLHHKTDSAGLTLTGRKFVNNEFNAALVYERVNKMGKSLGLEVAKFDEKRLQLVKPYPQGGVPARKKDPSLEISVFFGIKAWCIRRKS